MLAAGVFINIGNEHYLFIKSVFWQEFAFPETFLRKHSVFFFHQPIYKHMAQRKKCLFKTHILCPVSFYYWGRRIRKLQFFQRKNMLVIVMHVSAKVVFLQEELEIKWAFCNHFVKNGTLKVKCMLKCSG